jgi:two-component system, NtrC family, response regulator AtoC
MASEPTSGPTWLLGRRYAGAPMTQLGDGGSETTGVREPGSKEVTPTGVTHSSPGRLYLLVFERGSSWMSELPEEGEMIVGRSPEVALRLHDSAVSRRHAAFRVDGRRVTITDLDSHNGTRVNGQPIQGTHTLAAGDTIGICGANLVFYATGEVPNRPTPVVDGATLRQRLDDELERALRFQRSFSMICVIFPHTVAPLDVERVVSARLGRLDQMAWTARDTVHILSPELDHEDVKATAALLREELSAVAAKVRVGFVTCPTDGWEAERLLAGARAAAMGAEAGRVGEVASSFGTFHIGGHEVLVADPAMSRLYGLVERLAPSDLPVLITGETGTGKELLATALHERSPRRARAMIALNCAAIAENLVESELFGHERGAFSGAVAQKRGLLEVADGGTLFLDEVGELSMALQAKLLRVLELKRFMRVGDVKERQVDLRLVVATNRDLRAESRAGRFRPDLFFRLSAATLLVPPLQERPLDLPILAHHFLTEARRRLGRPEMILAPESLALLGSYVWPGNVRELKNMMDYVAATHDGGVVLPQHFADRFDSELSPGTAAVPVTPGESSGRPERRFRPIAEEVRELEERRIREALDETRGNHRAAADLIGMPLRTLFARIKQYGLRK